MTTYAYNAKGWLTSTSAVTTVTTNSYDGNGNLLSKSKAVGSAAAVVSTYTYDVWKSKNRYTPQAVKKSSAGQQLTKKDGRGYATSYTYDMQNRVLTANLIFKV